MGIKRRAKELQVYVDYDNLHNINNVQKKVYSGYEFLLTPAPGEERQIPTIGCLLITLTILIIDYESKKVFLNHLLQDKSMLHR